MELLLVLTLVYAGVLVLALAASLIGIWIYLRRIGGVLAQARGALEAVAQETSPLESHIQPLQDLSEDMADEMSRAEESLRSADDSLDRLAERLGAGSLIR